MKLRIGKERIFLALTLLRIVLAFVIGILILGQRRNVAAIFFIATALIAFFESLINKSLIEKSLLKSVLDFFADRFLVDIKNYPDEVHKLDADPNINKEFALKLMGTDMIIDHVQNYIIK